MHSSTAPRLVMPLLVALVMSLIPSQARAAETGLLLRNVLGTVEVSPGNRGEWITARAALALQVGDAVRTSADGSALLVHGPSELFLKADTTAVVGYQSVQLRQGALWFRMRKTPTGFKFITDVATATIRGTLGLLTTTGEVTTVALLRGKVEVDTVNRENYMLMPQFEVTARRNVPLQKTAMSGTRTTDLVGEFYRTTKALGGATGTPGGAAPATPQPGGDPTDVLKDGTGTFDPARQRSSSSTASNVNPAVAPLITIVDNTTNPFIQTANGAASNLTNTVGAVVGGVTTIVTPIVSGVTTPIVGGVTGGAGTLVGGVTGGVGGLVGGLTGGTTGGTAGGGGGLLGGLFGR